MWRAGKVRRPTVAPKVDVVAAREVPLGGGPRAMTVRRTLPQRARTLIGAWCFADHYGPGDARADWQASSDRFGVVEGYPGDRLPAPALPNATIKPRRNPATGRS